MKKSIFIIFTIIIFLSLPTPSLSQRCNKNDEKVLFQIKKSFGNPYILASWQKNVDCCEWYSIECHPKTGRIISLDISTGNISGQIPRQVGDLPYLKSLTFHKLPNLTGGIPLEITKLTHLIFLRLDWNNLSGPVPSFLSQLTNLDFLDLAFNSFTGSIPPELGALTLVTGIRLDRNNLTGPIPESFGKLTNLQYLYLSHNQLTGDIPRSLGHLINLTWIDLSRNQLTGDLSTFFGTNKMIQVADFSRNSLKFNLSKVELPASLIFFDLNHNKIYGSLPATLRGLSLQHLNVSYNRLCGKIPQGGDLQRFSKTEYFHNRCLCGSPLPACS
ncbi:hypothetical protein R6Q59_025733 [Mikania micrantha]